MPLSTLEPPDAPGPTPRDAPPADSSLGSYGAMVGRGGLEAAAGEADVEGDVPGSDGCFKEDFCGWRRGSVGPLRATRGSTGFSTGAGATWGGGPSSDIEGGGEGV